MVEITLKGEVAERLKEVASRQNMTPEAWVQEKLSEDQPVLPSNLDGQEKDEIDLPSNPLLRMAQIARDAALVFTENNVAERSREILETEFADDLVRRIQQHDSEPQ